MRSRQQIPLTSLEDGYRLLMMELSDGVHLIVPGYSRRGLQSAACPECNLHGLVCPFCGHFLESDPLVDQTDSYWGLKLWWSRRDNAVELNNHTAQLEVILGLKSGSIPRSNLNDAVSLMEVPVIEKLVDNYQVQSVGQKPYPFTPFLMSGRNGLMIETRAMACPSCHSRLRTWKTEGVNDWVADY